MQEINLEVLGLEVRNEILIQNIDKLETENAKLKSEASFLKEEIEDKNNKLYTNLHCLEEKHAILLHEFDEIKNKKKDKDDNVWELEKQVESQKSELAKANEKIEIQKKNEQGRNKLAEHLIKSCIEIKKLKSNIANLEAQNAGYKKNLDQMEKYCGTLRNHNEILSSNALKKTKIKDEGQGSYNNTIENFSKDNRGEPLDKLETKHAKLLHDFEEMKNKNKDRDYKVLELEKKFGSQTLELARVHDEISELAKAYEEIETQKENEQCMNTFAERLLQSHIKAKELESIVGSVEVQNADYKNRLDEIEKKCEILHLHNKILSLNGGKNYL